ncbi:MAG: protein kinase [Acidimicrobiia bacterium]
MATAIPDRFKLEMRLGRDGDIEEWLATDVSLDRPVLIRSLGPESSLERRRQFLEKVSQVASVSHPHLLKVFAVEQVPGGAYGVFEWTGGSTIADNVNAQRSVDLADFLPNAAGLAGALALLHEQGSVHGSVDLTAISYSVAHPAKLGGFGRLESTSADGDVRDLASVLETALTGSPPGGPPPSERIDGLSSSIDQILRSAQSGALTARDMEKALTAAPTPRAPAPEPRAASRRLMVAALVLVALAVALVVLGFFFSGGSAEPILPGRQPTTTSTAAGSTSIITVTTVAAGAVDIVEVSTFDPLGEGGEHDEEAPFAIDDDIGTVWHTESYRDPLPLIKAGLGLVFSVRGTPSTLEVVDMAPGTGFEVRWLGSVSDDPDDWERIATADAPPGVVRIVLPVRANGLWLLWLTDLPQSADGSYRSQVAEVRFQP